MREVVCSLRIGGVCWSAGIREADELVAAAGLTRDELGGSAKSAEALSRLCDVKRTCAFRRGGLVRAKALRPASRQQASGAKKAKRGTAHRLNLAGSGKGDQGENGESQLRCTQEARW